MTANVITPSALNGRPAPLKTVLSDVYRGFRHICRNGLALLGTAVAVALATLVFRADLRADAEQQLLGWLLQRQETAVDTATAAQPAADPSDVFEPASLTNAQTHVAQWLSRKYRVATEPLSVLVAEAFAIGSRERLDPTLILAVMAIESRFNPYAQSPVGAQGLMQVLTRVHTDKYANFGGEMAAFDPVSNLRVGAKVLQDCIKQAGSVEGGLRLYAGAVTRDGADYINKVMAEHLRIQSVALGKPMPTSFPVYSAAPPAPIAEPGTALPTQTGLLDPIPQTPPQMPGEPVRALSSS